MLDHDEYRAEMEQTAAEYGIDLGLIESAYVEQSRLTGMAPWEAVAIIS